MRDVSCRPPGRFIPTPVGNTRWTGWRAAWPTVHPHARGEHLVGVAIVPVDDGSSPRPWGTPAATAASMRRNRFIPTPVGNTKLTFRCSISASVHPHARGEHGRVREPDVLLHGSSPRPWGTPQAHPLAAGLARFIPTPVGNTVPSRKSTVGATVHPHARGEHSGSPARRWPARGSSPRPWGTRSQHRQQVGRGRFIPTPVGNT